MSIEIKSTGTKKTDLSISSFYGGETNGKMLQLTQGFGIDPDEPGFIQLTTRDAYNVVVELTKWIKSESRIKAEKLQKQIDKNKLLKKTIMKDAVECERFISELSILDLPLMLLGD